MAEPPIQTLIRWLWQAMPGRAAAAAILLVASGLVEGLSVLALIPLLDALGVPGSTLPSNLAALPGLPATSGITQAVLLFAVLQGVVAGLDWLKARHAGTLTVRLATWLRGQLLDGFVHMRCRALSGKDAGTRGA